MRIQSRMSPIPVTERCTIYGLNVVFWYQNSQRRVVTRYTLQLLSHSEVIDPTGRDPEPPPKKWRKFRLSVSLTTEISRFRANEDGPGLFWKHGVYVHRINYNNSMSQRIITYDQHLTLRAGILFLLDIPSLIHSPPGLMKGKLMIIPIPILPRYSNTRASA